MSEERGQSESKTDFGLSRGELEIIKAADNADRTDAAGLRYGIEGDK